MTGLKVFTCVFGAIVCAAISGAVYDAARSRVVYDDPRAEQMSVIEVLHQWERIRLLEVGRTTRRQCLDIMGMPSSRYADGSHESWMYDLYEASTYVIYGVIGPKRVGSLDLDWQQGKLSSMTAVKDGKEIPLPTPTPPVPPSPTSR